jgi:hypothetical protein
LIFQSWPAFPHLSLPQENGRIPSLFVNATERVVFVQSFSP